MELVVQARNAGGTAGIVTHVHKIEALQLDTQDLNPNTLLLTSLHSTTASESISQ